MGVYYKKIDGLRFLAISFVFIQHFAYFIGSKFSAGYYGVDLFFVISGFLITSILINSKEESFWKAYKKFIGRRTLRIFPIYYLTIFILLLLQLEIVKDNLFFLLTYTYNYASVYYKLPHNPVTHFWSLCVEEQFYLFWPIVVLSLNSNHKLLQWIIIFLIIIGFAQLSFKIIEPLNPYNYEGLFTRMGSLAMGALGSVMIKYKKIPDSVFQSRIMEYSIYFLLIMSLTINHPLKYPFLSICSLYLVLKSTHSDFSLGIVNSFLSNKYIVYLGTISYGIYVYHVPIAHYFEIYIFNQFWDSINWQSLGLFEIIKWNSWLLKLPLFSFLSIITAMFSFRFIEQPILKLKDKYFKY